MLSLLQRAVSHARSHVPSRAAAVALVAVPAALGAQTPAPAPATPSTTPVIGGTIRGNYQYLFDGPSEDFNQFALERVYVTLRGTPAARVAYRITTDVFQSGDDNGWTIRMKYAYLDYLLGGGRPWATTLRAGILQTVAIEQQEGFWPRWLGPVPIDRYGYFASADAGVAAQVALPARLGELYTHVVNGTGYVRRETDRFKDVGARLSLTPFAANENRLLASTTLSAWGYTGAVASRFADDSLGGVRTGLARDRWGVHAAVRDRRMTLAAEHSQRTDDVETGANTLASPRVVGARDGAVTSGFAIVRPRAFTSPTAPAPFGVIGRYDRVRPSPTGSSFHYALAGGIYDVNSRLSLSLNYQEQRGPAAPAPFRGGFFNVVLEF